MTADIHQLAREAADDVKRQYDIACADYHNIPQSLHGDPVWGFHTIRKIPISLNGVLGNYPMHDPLIHSIVYMKSNCPTTWATYPDVLRGSQLPNLHSSIVGPTIALSKGANLMIIDLDDPKKLINSRIAQREAAQEPPYTDAQIKAACAEADDVQRVCLQWADCVGAWVERSMSGNGYHVIVRLEAGLPYPAYSILNHSSIFHSDRLLHMTGKPPAAPISKLGTQSVRTVIPMVSVAAVHEFIDYLTRENALRPIKPKVRSVDGSSLDPTTAFGRRLDLTDEQVLERLPAVHKASAHACEGKAGKTGNWSDDTYILISDLDKISGDADQVHRILFRSPRMQSPGRGGDGKDRHERTARLFDDVLAKCRDQNDTELERRIEKLAEARRLQAVMASTVPFRARVLSPAERRAEARRAVARAEIELANRRKRAMPR